MSAVLSQVKQLNLPEGEYVVIGSGLLDALGLRAAHDLDLVVSDKLFDTLFQTGLYQRQEKHDTEVLLADDIEIWRDWGSDLTFDRLKEDAVTVDGVAFAHPSVIIEHKQRRGLPKDLADIELLNGYYKHD